MRRNLYFPNALVIFMTFQNKYHSTVMVVMYAKKVLLTSAYNTTVIEISAIND